MLIHTFPELCGNSSLHPHCYLPKGLRSVCYTGLFLNISSLDYIHFKTKHATRNTVDSSILRLSICCGLYVFVPVEYKAQGCFSMTSEESGFQAELLYSNRFHCNFCHLCNDFMWSRRCHSKFSPSCAKLMKLFKSRAVQGII